jgi:ADP-ribose pyrophosphatase
MKNSDYKLISRKQVYKGKKVNVFDETIQLPNSNFVEWDMVDFPDIFMAIPVTKDNQVLMVKQWRQGPKAIMTDFVGVRLDDKNEKGLDALRRELSEELGLKGGKYEKLVVYSNGVRISGLRTIFLVTEFDQEEANLDENEIVEKVQIPVKGLYDELVANHTVTSDTLLMAKLVEERNLRSNQVN